MTFSLGNSLIRLAYMQANNLLSGTATGWGSGSTSFGSVPRFFRSSGSPSLPSFGGSVPLASSPMQEFASAIDLISTLDEAVDNILDGDGTFTPSPRPNASFPRSSRISSNPWSNTGSYPRYNSNTPSWNPNPWGGAGYSPYRGGNTSFVSPLPLGGFSPTAPGFSGNTAFTSPLPWGGFTPTTPGFSGNTTFTSPLPWGGFTPTAPGFSGNSSFTPVTPGGPAVPSIVTPPGNGAPFVTPTSPTNVGAAGPFTGPPAPASFNTGFGYGPVDVNFSASASGNSSQFSLGSTFDLPGGYQFASGVSGNANGYFDTSHGLDMGGTAHFGTTYGVPGTFQHYQQAEGTGHFTATDTHFSIGGEGEIGGGFNIGGQEFGINLSADAMLDVNYGRVASYGGLNANNGLRIGGEIRRIGINAGIGFDQNGVGFDATGELGLPINPVLFGHEIDAGVEGGWGGHISWENGFQGQISNTGSADFSIGDWGGGEFEYRNTVGYNNENGLFVQGTNNADLTLGGYNVLDMNSNGMINFNNGQLNANGEVSANLFEGNLGLNANGSGSIGINDEGTGIEANLDTSGTVNLFGHDSEFSVSSSSSIGLDGAHVNTEVETEIGSASLDAGIGLGGAHVDAEIETPLGSAGGSASINGNGAHVAAEVETPLGSASANAGINGNGAHVNTSVSTPIGNANVGAVVNSNEATVSTSGNVGNIISGRASAGIRRRNVLGLSVPLPHVSISIDRPSWLPSW